jgi:hypothetical protein
MLMGVARLAHHAGFLVDRRAGPFLNNSRLKGKRLAVCHAFAARAAFQARLSRHEPRKHATRDRAALPSPRAEPPFQDPTVLLDSGHRTWLLGTAAAAAALVSLYAVLDARAPGGLTGGSTVGLWYGTGGSLLMVYAGLLAAHRKLARWRFLPGRSGMLKGHIWLGLLSFVLILCHSGCRWGGPLERVLWVVLGLVLLTGVLGLGLQQFLPRLLSQQIAEETPYEQVPHVTRQLLLRADALVDRLCGEFRPAQKDGASAPVRDAKTQLRGYYESEIRPFLNGGGRRSPALLNPVSAEQVFVRLRAMPELAGVQGELQQLETLCTQRRLLIRQERLYHWLHGWLLVHVPLSVALLVLGLAHAILSLYY